METRDLIQLHEETFSCNLKAFDKYDKKHYTLKGINDLPDLISIDSLIISLSWA